MLGSVVMQSPKRKHTPLASTLESCALHARISWLDAHHRHADDVMTQLDGTLLSVVQARACSFACECCCSSTVY